MSSRVARIAFAGALIAVALGGAGGRSKLFVPAGMDVQAVLDSAPRGAIVALGPGVHAGPLRIEETLVLTGEPGARIVAGPDDVAVTVAAPRAAVTDLAVEGGWTAIELHDAAGSVVRDVAISKARLEGILVYKAPATIVRVTISDPSNPHAQGIETVSAPDVVVRDSVVAGGTIGIDAHLSTGIIENNEVRGTSIAGIMIGEMSAGTARNNVVSDATGAGLYCGDQSRCAFERNRAERIEGSDTGRSSAGWGLVVNYHSTASVHDDRLAGAAGDMVVLIGSRMTERSALERGAGSRAIWPAAAAGSLALMVLLLVRRLMGPLASGLARRDGRRSAIANHAIRVLAVGVAVQTFHMAEHFLQVFRVHVDGVPSRGGIVGPIVEPEVIHFSYNTLVLVAFGFVLLARARGWRPRDLSGDGWLMAAVAVQGYHVIEHATKLLQHVTTGAKVNPGLLGHQVDLVLFHFGINLAVYLGFVIAGALYADLPGRARRMVAAWFAPEPAPVGPAGP